MKSGLSFLMAAKRCEIAGLEALALTSALVNLTGQLVHALQRERGLSNLYLGSKGSHFGAEREAQIAASGQAEAALRHCLDSLDTEAAPVGNGARLFSRIAYVLQGLNALPFLRAQVAQQAWSARQATEAYVRLIAGLLAVVFEAADSAPDPDISRLLVARFNFMQGKELAGQERAVGSALFASGRADSSEQQRLLHLIESQEHCLRVFTEFSSAALGTLWAQCQPSTLLAELERMRRVLCTAAHGAPLDATQSPVWFACCSQRVDAMKQVEDQLAHGLQQACEQRMAAAQQELTTLETLRPSTEPPRDEALSFFQDAHSTPLESATQPSYGLQLQRSMLELVQEQARRLQSMSEELDTVRASLNERKLVERAKGLLMAHQQLSEAEAHKTLRQMAMNQNRRLLEVAEAVLAMADVLPTRPR
jgi:hypothetical protein